MTSAILFWMAKPLAEFLMAFLVVIGLGCLMVVGVALKHVINRLNAWVDKQRGKSK